jgi:ribonuclease E
VSEVLQVGQPLLVQLKKEEEGGKGAAFTTDVTLASSYTVISPVSGGEFTMSRKITDAKVKRSFKAMMKQCDAEGQYGVMLRTASEGRESHEVLADLQTQLRAWGFIQADFQSKRTPCLLYKESQLITRMVRDHFTDDVDEVILDDEEAFEDLKRYCEERLPNAIPKLRLCEERLPLFVRYKVEGQINQLTTHILELPSGGNISVNHTEAATVFDINSSRQSGGGDQQQMFLITNCEAAELIARQVRLRGIGGLIFIDFINMREQRHRRQVEKVFKEAIKRDRAHLEVGVISRFCVLELSRNRIQERSLSTTHTSCPTCSGSGYIPSPNVVAFKLINSLYALAERIGPGRVIKGKLPVAHAMYLLNDKRAVLVDLEERYGVNIEIEVDFI